MDTTTNSAQLVMQRTTHTETQTIVTKREASRPRSRLIYDFPTEKLAQYMHLRQDKAAKALGIATITLKRICHRRQIRWPYRAYKSQLKRLAVGQTAINGEDHKSRAELESCRICPRPVSKDVPKLMPRSLQAQYTTQRPKLPSLAETLGSPVASIARVYYPLKQRQHLTMPRDQTFLSMKRPHLPMPSDQTYLSKRPHLLVPSHQTYLSKQRPHLSMSFDQPPSESAPTLPRINMAKTNGIFHTPTYATRSPKKKFLAPTVSPAMVRFRLLPSIDSGRLVARTIG